MKTAMQDFIDNIIPMHVIQLPMIKNAIKKALEKEKEQIVKAHGDKVETGFGKNGFWSVTITGEKYYNETYNQNQI